MQCFLFCLFYEPEGCVIHEAQCKQISRVWEGVYGSVPGLCIHGGQRNNTWVISDKNGGCLGSLRLLNSVWWGSGHILKPKRASGETLVGVISK